MLEKLYKLNPIFIQVDKNCHEKGLDWKSEDDFQQMNQCSSGRAFQKVFAW